MYSTPLIAVTGASGLLGRPLMTLLENDRRYRVRGAALSRAGGALDRLDLTDGNAVETWLDEMKPTALIHLAAERRPDVYAQDPEAADRLNIDSTQALAAACASRDVPLLFLSTNYVFDGTAPPYHPTDKPNPLNDYGRSKLAGETSVIKASPRHRLLRIPMLYGPSENLEESSVTTIARAFLKTDQPVLLDVRQTRYPAYTPDVAAAILGMLPGLIDGSLAGPALHFCPAESFTKRDMGEIMAPLVGADPHRAVPDDRPPSGAPRPQNVGLACPYLEELGLLKTTPFREAISRTLESIHAAGGIF
ncbi:MAG: SDR family oxidoreductase [Spirochaetaceae bacterium]|nr:SDR family oxidoreductase [Spirochaetaceae bacterium]